MTLRTWGDFQRAFEEGKFHIQRIIKLAGSTYAHHWADVSFASGQPPYDAHIGNPLEFTPCISTKNKAIYFPDIPSNDVRYLTSISLRPSQASFLGPTSIILYDLLGYYPMIDGDSTDLQTFDNTYTLPRYSNGVGVFPILVNHISPPVQNGVATIDYINHNGISRSITVNVPLTGMNLVCSGVRPAAGSDIGPLVIALAGADRGVRQVNSITYSTPPGGMQCLYLARIIATIVGGDNNLFIEKEFVTKNTFNAPIIPDGAWLGWFSRLASGTATTCTWFGDFTFAWG